MVALSSTNVLDTLDFYIPIRRRSNYFLWAIDRCEAIDSVARIINNFDSLFHTKCTIFPRH